MPYIDEDLLDDEEQDGQISAGSGVIGAGGPSDQQAANTAKKGSGQFANLDEYLRVNQPQAFGENLAGKVGEDVSKASDAVDQTGQQFRSRVDQSTIAPDEDVVSRATGKAPSKQDGQPNTMPVYDPSEFVKDENNVDAWNKLFNAKYTGPAQFEDSADLFNSATGAAKTAVGKASAANSEGGRFALLDTYFGKPTYSAGQKSLDNLLVQNDTNANQAFDQVQRNADELSRRQREQGAELDNYGTQGKASTEAARKMAREAIGVDDGGNYLEGQGALGELNSSVDKRVSDILTKYRTNVGSIKQALANRDFTKLSPQLRQELGADGLNQIFNFNLESYFNAVPESNINKNSVATSDEQRRMAALSKLAELDNTFLPYADEAGKVGADDAFYSFRKDDLARDIAKAQSDDKKFELAARSELKDAGAKLREAEDYFKYNNPLSPGYDLLAPKLQQQLDAAKQVINTFNNKLATYRKNTGYNNVVKK